MKKKLGILGLALAAILTFGTVQANAGVHFGVSVGPAYPVYPYAYQYPYPSPYPYTYSPYYSPYAYSYAPGYYGVGGIRWGGRDRYRHDDRNWHEGRRGHVRERNFRHDEHRHR